MQKLLPIILIANISWANEEVLHRLGNRYEFAGSVNNEYLPSAGLELLRTVPARGVSGDIPNVDREKIFSCLGLFSEPYPLNDFEKMLEQNSSKIPSSTTLMRALRYLQNDFFFASILKSFFEDGGFFNIVPLGSNQAKFGHYDRTTLRIRLGDMPFEVLRLTLMHELLHYTFDKMDLHLSESPSMGGADHLLIENLEVRFEIIRGVEMGELPLGQTIIPLHGFLAIGPLASVVERLDNENRIGDLFTDINRKNFVYSSLVGILSSLNNYRLGKPWATYPWSDADVSDMAFLGAYNADIWLSALKLAYKQEGSLVYKNRFSTPEFQTRWKQYLRQICHSNVIEVGPYNLSERILSSQL